MSESFEHLRSSFLVVAAGNTERQQSRLQLLCRALHSLHRRLSPGLLRDRRCRQCFILLKSFNQHPQRWVIMSDETCKAAVPRLADCLCGPHLRESRRVHSIATVETTAAYMPRRCWMSKIFLLFYVCHCWPYNR